MLANLISYHAVKVVCCSFISSRIGQPLSSWLKQKENNKIDRTQKKDCVVTEDKYLLLLDK